MKSLGGLRDLLDIYSARPVSRIAVLAMFALGTVMLARGASTGSAFGALPFLLLLWANHATFVPTVVGLVQSRPWIWLALPLLVMSVRIAMLPPTASDDLLRHIAVSSWPNGYADMYVHSSLPSAPLYPSFDWLAGVLAGALGALGAMWVLQAAAAFGFVAVFAAAALRALSGTNDRWMWTSLALLVVLDVMVGRLFLARPEIFLAIWSLAALLPRSRAGSVAWGVAGVVLGSGYWLAPIYFPAALLLPLSARQRAAVFALMSMGWLAMWTVIAGDQLIPALWWQFGSMASVNPALVVSENVSVFNLLISLPMVALIGSALWAAGRPGTDPRLLWLSAYFVVSNQVRYGSIIAPLLALYALGGFGPRAPRSSDHAKGYALAAAAIFAALLSSRIPALGSIPAFKTPDGAVVLTAFTEATYSTSFFNPGRVKVAPAFAIGAADRELQEVVVDLVQGRLDCPRVAALGFSHVVEHSLSGAPPSCLTLVQTQAQWRLWAIAR